MITRLIADTDNPVRYQDDTTGRIYGAIAGGLAWPSQDDLGRLVVLARDHEPDSQDHYHYWLLVERDGMDIGSLVRRAMDLRGPYHVTTWVGHTGHKASMYLFHEIMQQYDYRDRLSLDMAPYAKDAGGMALYLGLILECVQPGRKVLHLGSESSAADYLARADHRDLNGTPDNYPPIAALGYALSALYGYGCTPALLPEINLDQRYSGQGWMM